MRLSIDTATCTDLNILYYLFELFQLESVKTRLQSSSWEVDKAEQARSEVERFVITLQ